MPGAATPAPADPYPLMAAGWGPEVGNGLLYSRWAEDWTGMRAAGKAPPLKAMPLGGDGECPKEELTNGERSVSVSVGGLEPAHDSSIGVL